MIEREWDCKIKKLWSGNETKYTTKEFEKFFDHEGIKHQLNVSYTLNKME